MHAWKVEIHIEEHPLFADYVARHEGKQADTHSDVEVVAEEVVGGWGAVFEDIFSGMQRNARLQQLGRFGGGRQKESMPFIMRDPRWRGPYELTPTVYARYVGNKVVLDTTRVYVGRSGTYREERAAYLRWRRKHRQSKQGKQGKQGRQGGQGKERKQGKQSKKGPQKPSEQCEPQTPESFDLNGPGSDFEFQ